MKEPRINALKSLMAAFEAREVYGAQHSSAAESATRCAQAFAQIAKSTPSVTIALVAGGVMIDGLTLTDRWSTDSPLIAELRHRGVQVIRIVDGVDSADLQWLFDCAKGGTGSISPSRRIVLGQVQIEARPAGSVDQAADDVSGDAADGDSASDPTALSNAQLVDPLRESWSAVLTRTGGNQDVRIASLASRIIATAVQSRHSILSLVDLKAHDEYTFVHVTNVAIIASALGEAVGLSGDRLHHLTEAALLHDVGKWTIPKRILSKPSKLDDAEFAIVRQHPAVGALMLAGARGVSDVSVIVAFEHHMRIDGTGYPELATAPRPLVISQIVHLADVFDALRSHRPYRAGMPLDECLRILDEQAGRAFDRELYAVFCDRVLRRLPVAAASANWPDQRTAA